MDLVNDHILLTRVSYQIYSVGWIILRTRDGCDDRIASRKYNDGDYEDVRLGKRDSFEAISIDHFINHVRESSPVLIRSAEKYENG